MLKRDLREREELIQQREIDISCLRGQVKQALEELEAVKLGLEEGDDDSDTLTCECVSDEEILVADLDDSWEI